MKELRPINKLSPFLVSKIWGGERIAKFKKTGKTNYHAPIGESWEISVHPEGPCLLDNLSLNHFISSEHLPYLVKFIDTADNLSIQVHPDDQYAMRKENSVGKSECWVILDCLPSSGIYLGVKPGITRESFEKALLNNENIDQLLNFYKVSKGDFFYVPAGTIHAIGKNIFLCEIQQNSGITYRVWDWNRLGENNLPRKLHVKSAMEVIKFEESFNHKKNFMIKNNIFVRTHEPLIKHREFEVEYYHFTSDLEFKTKNKNRLNGLVCLEGQITLSYGNQEELMEQWDSVLLKPDLVFAVKVRSLNGCKVLWVG